MRSESREPRPALDRVSAAHVGIVELFNDLQVNPASKSREGLMLPLSAVLVGSDIRCA